MSLPEVRKGRFIVDNSRRVEQNEVKRSIQLDKHIELSYIEGMHVPELDKTTRVILIINNLTQFN